MIKHPAVFLTILILIGLVIIVFYQVQTDPIKKDSILELYNENIVTCHGKTGQGQSDFPSLQKTELNVDRIKELISKGQGDMPAFPQIKEAQLSLLAKMVKQLSG